MSPKQIDGGVSGLDLDADAVVAIVGGERTHTPNISESAAHLTRPGM